MLSKKFNNNKFYQVRKWIEVKDGVFKKSETVWDTVEKSRNFINKAAKAANFAGAEIWVHETSRPITADDFKNGKYEIINIYPNY